MTKPNLFILAIVLISSLLIEVAVIWPMPNGLIIFNSLFITVAAVSFITNWQKATGFALVQGWLLDLYSPQLFGLYLISGVILVWCIAGLRATWLKQTSLLMVAVIAAISLAVIQLFTSLWQWLDERWRGSAWQLINDVPLSWWLVGWLAMIVFTVGLVRLLSKGYAKLI